MATRCESEYNLATDETVIGLRCVHDAGHEFDHLFMVRWESAEGESDTRQRGIRKDKHMAVVPQPVTTRRVALANEYGATGYDLTADGFTDEYFTVVRTPNLSSPDIRVTLVIEDGMYEKFRVWWRDTDRERARQAIEGDNAEMFGGSMPTHTANE